MLIHDPSDVFLETAKIFNYTAAARPWAQVRACLEERGMDGWVDRWWMDERVGCV